MKRYTVYYVTRRGREVRYHTDKDPHSNPKVQKAAIVSIRLNTPINADNLRRAMKESGFWETPAQFD